MLKVFVDPIPKLGLAMQRVALALRATAPPWVRVVDRVDQADVQVLHPVSLQARKHLHARKYAVMMHCLDLQQDPKGGGGNVPIVAPGMEPWHAPWSRALVVWSYYDIGQRFLWGKSWIYTPEGAVDVSNHQHSGSNPGFYHAPLGVDGDTFALPAPNHIRDVGILTTGYVSGPNAEAIEEAAVAAHRAGLTTVHLGPSQVAGMTASVPGWSAVSNVSDAQLATIYGRCRWVSGLRHGEGFELPVLEGLACGARPICFDLPCYRRWFDGHAVFVPDCSGEELINRLTEVMSSEPKPVTPQERDAALRTFDWHAIGRGFWTAMKEACLADGEIAPLVFAPPAVPVVSMSPRAKRKLLWVGDSPTTDWTGFGRASRHIVEALARDWDVTVLGTTHDGSPYDRERFPYDVWPWSGKGAIARLATDVKPDVIVLQHDPWQVAGWLKEIGHATAVAVMPIDGTNCRCEYLNKLALAIWWTKFADTEARLGGYAGPSAIVPLGVDLDAYLPLDKKASRARLGLPPELHDAFIVGVVARNQPRKRLDLTVRHFAEWVKSCDVPNAYLYVQTAPTGECAYDVSELMRYEKLSSRLILVEPKMRKTMSEQGMAHVYSSLDVYFTTTQGEGWCLPAMEAMACGTAVVAPGHSAFGDWAREAAHLVPIAEVAGTINPMSAMSGIRVAVMGGVPDRAENVRALDRIYRDVAYREHLAERGLALVQRPEYRWPAIGEAFSRAVAEAVGLPARQAGRVVTGEFLAGPTVPTPYEPAEVEEA